MENKTCTVCNIEKHINNFYKKYSECKECNIRRGEKNVFLIIKIKYQFNKKYIMKKIEKKLFQKQNDYRNKRNTDFKDLVRSYNELQNRLKTLEENVSINDSEKH